MNHTSKIITIIGAGPAGLAVAGRFSKLDIPFQILERSDRIANSWHDHYDRLCLHTVKRLSGLPHMGIPDDVPKYVPRDDLIKYYSDYADKFNIKPTYGEEVVSLTKNANQQWEIKCLSGKEYRSSFVIVATGASRVPFQPNIMNLDKYEGFITHSKYYKNATPYFNQRVLVIGMGNSGAEIALDLCNNGAEAWISIRGGVNIVPRDMFGRSTQETARNLARLPFSIGDWLGNQIKNLVVGDLRHYGIPKVGMTPAGQLRKTGRTPVIDIGTLERIRSDEIKICQEIIEFKEKGVLFKDGVQKAFDSVIFATGYKPGLPDFIKDISNRLDENGVPTTVIEKDPFSGLYYIGFNIYEVGGILLRIYNDSEIIVRDVNSKLYKTGAEN